MVVNLPCRSDRSQKATVELARIGSAFDDKTTYLFGAIRPKDKAGFLSFGWRGCALSHLDILETAVEGKRLNGSARLMDAKPCGPIPLTHFGAFHGPVVEPARD